MNQFSAEFVPTNIFSNTCEGETTTAPVTYWVTTDSHTGVGFVMDLGDQFCIRKVSLKNTHNRGHRDRGTKNFSIQVSNDEGGPYNDLIANQELEDARSLECEDIPVHEFEVCECFRYLRFVINEFYGFGGGLHYLHLE